MVEDARQYPVAAGEAFRQWWGYSVDVAQRWLLFVDVLRQRANNMLAHEEAGLPAAAALRL
ncbi:hypothetical protein D9M68_205560 [compost metagenome]